MTTKAYSPYSSSGTVSTISPRSTIKLDTYCDTIIRGCSERCPCRTWPQCHYYNSAIWKESRGRDKVIWEDIHEYYETFFKYKPGLPDIVYPNG